MTTIANGRCRLFKVATFCGRCREDAEFRKERGIDHCPHGRHDPGVVLPPPRRPGGPGSELKAILAGYGIKPGNCRCNSMAARMDAWGPDGCEGEHAAEIIAHLEREASAHAWLRFAPFKAVGAHGLLALAIARSRRN